jgi:hypothetical protein
MSIYVEKPKKSLCIWCGNRKKHFSEWDQKSHSDGKYHPLCRPCANKRLRNPWNGLLDMVKRIGKLSQGDTGKTLTVALRP